MHQAFGRRLGSMNFLEPRVLRRTNYANADGCNQIYMAVRINNKRKKISLGIHVRPEDFDDNEGRVRASHKLQFEYNMIIAAAIGKSIDILVQAAVNNRSMNVDEFEKVYENFESRADFVLFMDQESISRRGSVSDGTYAQHAMFVEKFKKFKSSVQFSNVDLNLLKDFDKYLRVTCKNNANTRHKNFKYLSYYINRAIEEGVRFENPFKKFIWPKTTNRVVFLDAEECKKLYEYYTHTDNKLDKKYIRIWFLMMATGLRVSDALTVTRDNIFGNMIVFSPIKTRHVGKTTSIPITDFARQFIDFESKTLSGQTPSQQAINSRLKKIALMLGIKKNVTNHVARHTFATHFLMNGGDILSLQKVLNHSDIKDTMIYEHITNEFKSQKMNLAFDQFFEILKQPNK